MSFKTSENASNYVAVKEAEYVEALRQQVAALERSLEQRDAEMREESDRLHELKAAFKENYRLLQTRTDELESAEQASLLAKNALRECQDRITTLNTQLEDAQNKIREEQYAKENQRQTLQDLLDRRAHEAEVAAHARDLAANRAAEEASSAKRKLESKILQLTEALAAQKRELVADQDSRLREAAATAEKQIHDAELSTHKEKLVAEHLQIELAQLETWRVEHINVEKKLHIEVSELKSQLEIKLSINQELEDKITEMEHQLTLAHTEIIKIKDETAETVTAADKRLASAIKAKESEEERVQTQVAELIQKLESVQAANGKKDLASAKKVRKIQSTLEEREDEIKRQSTIIEEKDKASRKLEAEMERLRNNNMRLESGVQFHKNAAEHARNELLSAEEQIEELKKVRTDLELEFTRKAEEIERQQLERGESLLKQTQAARREAELRCNELAAALQAKEQFAASLLRDRDLALNSLKQAGLELSAERHMEVETSSTAIARVQELEARNSKLTDLVKQMRSDMEQLASLKNADTSAGSAQIDEEASGAGQSSGPQRQRLDMIAQLRRQQVRIKGLEEQLEVERAQVADMSTRAEQLEFQVGSAEHHHSAELLTLRRRLAEAELSLAESRREADEFYKGGIEMSRRAERLEAELNRVHKNSERERPGDVNFGGQEVLIEQLKQEVDRLQMELADAVMVPPAATAEEEESATVAAMRSKLKVAIGRLKTLAKENETLKSINNRLTFDLRQTGHNQPNSGKISTRRQPATSAPAAATPMLSKASRMAAGLPAADPPLASVRAGMRHKMAELERAHRQLPPPQTQRTEFDEQEEDGNRTLAMSSIAGGESLTEVWKLLDGSTARLADKQSSVTSGGTLNEVPSLKLRGKPMKFASAPRS